MGRILAIDFGLKRTGIAVSDPLRIIATPLDTVPTATLLDFLKAYCTREVVDEFVVGMPKTVKNTDSEIAPVVRNFIVALKAAFPEKPIHEADERFTSTLAQRAMREGGMKKKDRRVKENVDKISATLILQAHMAATPR